MTGDTHASGLGEPMSGSTGETGEPRLHVAPGGSGEKVPNDPQALAEDIERSRQDLGETVEALATKLDVGARARDKAAQMKTRIAGATADVVDRVSEKSGDARQQLTNSTARAARAAGDRPVPVAIAAGVVLAVAGLLTWMLRRR
ncbi:MAG: DUF3618 domain-containing protein [Micromonosporaceae bacterium]